MKTFTRKLSYVDAQDLLQVIGLADGLIDAEKLVLGKLQKKWLGRVFKQNVDVFEEKREAALKIGEQSIKWTDDDKAKKDIELKHVELSAIANAILNVLSGPKSRPSHVQMIITLIDDDCLMLDRHINNNVKMDKIKLIEVPEDKDLIPEEAGK